MKKIVGVRRKLLHWALNTTHTLQVVALHFSHTICDGRNGRYS